MSFEFTHGYRGKKYLISTVDSQRSKLYAAENEALWEYQKNLLEDPSVEGCEAYANKIVSSATWKKLAKEHDCPAPKRIKVRPGYGARVARGGGSTITLPRWARTKPVILHELTHCLLERGCRHNWPFARAYADLVGRFLGSDAKKALHAAYKKHRVKHRPPRQMTDEQRAALGERGKKALAKWKAEQS